MPRAGRAARTTALLCSVAGLPLWGCGAGTAAPPAEARRAAITGPAQAAGGILRDADRAVAFGHLIDAPRQVEVIDEGIDIAEKLCQRYGLDSGNRLADRIKAAERARQEVLQPDQIGEQQIEAMARSLGYSLDPAACADYCDNVRRLARVEIQKRALRDFAESRPAGPAGQRRAAR